MPRRRSKKKTDFNQYLPWIIVGALVLVFLVIGADPTGKFTEVTEYSFVTETGEMYDTQDIPAVELTQEGIPGARESQDIYVLSNNVKIIKLDNVPSELDAGTLISALYIEHSENAVAVDLSELSRYELTFTMYLPNLGSGVFICPEAKTLSQVTEECQNIQNIEHDQLTASAEQYIIEGLFGTGGQSNPPTQPYYQDSDGDGYGNPSVSQTSSTPPQGYVSDNTDCDDSNSNLYQYLTGYSDGDSDSYGAGSAQQVCSSSSLPSGYVYSLSNGEDCNDTKVSVWQLTSSYIDNDGDGYGTGSTQQQVCTSNPVQDNTDCDDSDAYEYEEYCRDGDKDKTCSSSSPIQSNNPQIYCGPGSDLGYAAAKWTILTDAERDAQGTLYVDCNPANRLTACNASLTDLGANCGPGC